MNSDDNISCEIAKISKTITDHADEIYKTWKHYGLAPTEIFNWTSNDILETNLKSSSSIGSSSSNNSSNDHQFANAEGLQKLVNSFVIRDKARNRSEQVSQCAITTTTTTTTSTVAFRSNKDESESAKSVLSSAIMTSPHHTTPRLEIPSSSSFSSLLSLSSPSLRLLLPSDEENACVAKTQLFRQRRQQLLQQTKQHNQKPTNQPRKSNEINCETRRTSNLSIDYLKDSFFDCCNFRDELEIRKNPKDKIETKISKLNKIDILQERFKFFDRNNNNNNYSYKNNNNDDDNDDNVDVKSKFYNYLTNIAANMKENLSVNGCIENNNNTNNNNNNSNNNNNNNNNNVIQKDSNYIEKKLTEENVMEIIPSAPAATMPAPTRPKPKYKHLDNGNGNNNNNANGQDKHSRPILTRGSVAERVLLFEKCPDVNTVFRTIKRPVDPPLKTNIKIKLHADPQESVVSLQKELRTSGKSVYIPRFYFPHGKPQPTIAMEKTLRGILGAFDSFPNNQVTKDELPRILKICGLPYYWRAPVLLCTQQSPQSGLVERQRFVEFWKQMSVYCHDAASRFVYILSRGQRFRSYILPEDLVPLVQDVVDTHPGLSFLKEAVEFHSRYVHTVIARIFYNVNRSWSGKITISELKKSDLLEIINLLEEEDDINQIMAFFSYEHFYVIYCKFWELDSDHDLLISQDDLARHSDHALSTRIIERIFSGCVTRGENVRNVHPEDAKMTYTDFVWFLLSEEDKRSPTAIEYWFRCMDLDGDGILSMYELEYFYEEQQQRMESIGIETLPYEDCLCQMLDMVKPKEPGCVTLGDLKRCRMTHVFFDTFFNLEKYLDHEQRDPFAVQRDEYSSDWDRFAAQEYELLITEDAD